MTGSLSVSRNQLYFNKIKRKEKTKDERKKKRLFVS